MKQIYNNDYMALFSNGTLGFSDGVGYIGTLTVEETKELYQALKKFFEAKEQGEQ